MLVLGNCLSQLLKELHDKAKEFVRIIKESNFVNPMCQRRSKSDILGTLKFLTLRTWCSKTNLETLTLG